MNYVDLKLKAIELRKKGFSYGEIKKELNGPASKSTLSLWLKGIVLKPEHKERLYTKKIQVLSRGTNSQRERRLREIEEIVRISKEQVKIPISFETTLLVGSAIYWAEGSKGRMMEITNSDPALIVYMVKWIEIVFGLSAKDLKARLNIYSQQNENDLKNFWSNLTGVPVKSFGKTYVKPANKGYKKNNLYYGTIRIEVPKSSNMRHQIFGWITGLLKNIDPHVKLTQKKWKHLSSVARPINLED